MGSFAPNELDAEYMDVLTTEFIRNISNIREVDFLQGPKTTNEINRWISDMTKGKIPELYEEPLGPDTLIVLASTLYFKASWKGKFDLIPKGSPEDKRLCFATSTEGLIKGDCADVQWMVKEGEMSHRFLQNRRGATKVRATIIDIPLKHKTFDIDGQDTHQVWYNIAP